MGMFRRMGLMGLFAMMGLARQQDNQTLLKSVQAAYMGGYSAAAHGWSGKRGKMKGWQRQTGRRSKAQRRARAA